MKKYPKMKPSGVEWIGDVPEHWEVKSLHWLLSEPLKYGANEPAEDDDPTQPRYIRITDFGDDGRLRDDTFKSLPIEKAQDYFLTEGDILFARSGATVGKTFQFKNYEGKACFAGYLIKASADKEKLLSDFLYYFTKSNGYENWKNAIFNQATIQNIGADKYRSLPTPLPSLPEQTAIAAYLDRKTAQIDQSIAEKERLIELFREERQAIINQAVTKGIRPGAKMKPSGVEWIGDVPEGWGVVPLPKYLESIVDYRGRTPEKVESGIFLITARNIKNGKIDYSKSEEYVDEKEYEAIMGRGKPEIGDVLFTTEAPLGEVANIDNVNVALAQRIIKFRAKAGFLDNYFLKCWILSHSFQNDLQTYATGSTALGIKASKLNYLKVVLPPLHEQIEIVAYLDQKTTQIDTAIFGIRQEIALLQEYRQALIFEAVTGKIKVA